MKRVAIWAAALTTAAAVPASFATAAGATQSAPGSHKGQASYQLSTIFSGTTLGISQPDDVTTMGHHVFVTFQNGVGPQGQPSPSGNRDSTIVELTPQGAVEQTWNLVGHCDGLTADPRIGKVIATVNEDLNSSLYTINPHNARVVHYRYSPSHLPHNGGTDAISVTHFGQILISASAPGTVGAPAPQARYPAVYVVTLHRATRRADVTSLFSDEAKATIANTGPREGRTTRLALTDPDSNEMVPADSPRFAGDFVLDSQGDKQHIYVKNPGLVNQRLSVLDLSQSINDTAWATRQFGTLYITDNTDNLVDVLRGRFVPGTAFVAVTPCDADGAPATCPAPGFPPNYLGTLNMFTGKVIPVNLHGEMVQAEGLTFQRGIGRRLGVG